MFTARDAKIIRRTMYFSDIPEQLKEIEGLLDRAILNGHDHLIFNAELTCGYGDLEFRKYFEKLGYAVFVDERNRIYQLAW